MWNNHGALEKEGGKRVVSLLHFCTICWKESSPQAGISRKGLSLGLGLVSAGTTADCSGTPALEEEMSILYEGCSQSIVRLTAEDKDIFLLWMWSLTGRNEITTIWDGWNSFGRRQGGGSLEGMAVPRQGDELHNLIGVFHLWYLWLPDYW